MPATLGTAVVVGGTSSAEVTARDATVDCGMLGNNAAAATEDAPVCDWDVSTEAETQT